MYTNNMHVQEKLTELTEVYIVVLCIMVLQMLCLTYSLKSEKRRLLLP